MSFKDFAAKESASAQSTAAANDKPKASPAAQLDKKPVEAAPAPKS